MLSSASFAQIKFGAKGGLNFSDTSLGANFKGDIVTQNITVTAGPTGGTSSSQTTTETIDQTLYVATSPKVSFYLGGFMEYPINKKGNLAIKAELLYCQNGATIDKKTATEDQDIYYTSEGASYSVGQINVPILLKFTTNKKIAFHAGGYFGTLLFAKATSSSGLGVDYGTRFKTFDLGLNLGASYPISKKLVIEVRYNRGLLNLDKFKETSDSITAQGLYYNRTFHVGLEYLF